MASKQKYIEVEEPYEIDEAFVDGIMEVKPKHRVRVLKQINDSLEYFEFNEEDTSEAGGRIDGDLYYKIEYYNIEDWIPVLLAFTVIDVDDYLDMMVDKQLILE